MMHSSFMNGFINSKLEYPKKTSNVASFFGDYKSKCKRIFRNKCGIPICNLVYTLLNVDLFIARAQNIIHITKNISTIL